MTPAADPNSDRAFAALHRRLVSRRLAAVEPVLRVELVAVAALIGSFLWLQVRPLFEDLARQGGPERVAAGVAISSLVLAAIATGLVAARHARRLRRPEGPAWLALPIEPTALAAHLAWESRAQAAWVAVPAITVLVAALGLAPVGWLVVLAAGMVGLAGLGARIGVASATRRVGSVESAGPIAAVPRHVPARFRGGPAWRAILHKDAIVVTRNAALRQSAFVVLALAVVSLVGWLLPGEPGRGGGSPATTFDLRNLATFFVTLLCAGATAEALVLLVGSDPFAVLRALPLGVRTVWAARLAWAALLAGGLGVGHALLSHGLTLGARLLFVAWVAGATLGLAVLGVNFAMTLYPRTGPARQMLALTLVVVGIASIAFFLSGWLLLVAAIVHTTRRLPRWERAEQGA